MKKLPYQANTSQKMSVITINNDGEFQPQLTSAPQKLVVIDFTAAWCGPCKQIAPVFQRLAVKYPQVVFLKVDVDVCQETAMAQQVSSMPTFLFFKNGVRIDRMSGANPQLLEEKVKQHCGTETEDSLVKGHVDLYPFLMKNQCVEALNEADDHPLPNCLQDDGKFLESDCDNQLIIPITFSQAVKIHSLRLKGPESSGPKNIKIFINQPSILDFDKASQNVPAQSLEIASTDLTAGNPVNLQFVKFQNVQNMQIFVENNHDGSDTTRIDYLQLFGSPIQTTNMSDFKRVAGKEGEVDH